MPILIGTIFSGLWRGILAILEFCSKPPGVYIAAAIAVYAAIWWSGEHGYHKGYDQRTAEYEQAGSKEKVRREIVYVKVEAKSNVRTGENKANDAKNAGIVDNVGNTVSKQPDADQLFLPASIADQLRDIK